MTNALLKAASPDHSIMQSHRENYKGWKVTVEISGHCQGEHGATGSSHYVPRIVVTEQLSIGFRELQVETELSFLTPAQCFQGGIRIARRFIDGRA